MSSASLRGLVFSALLAGAAVPRADEFKLSLLPDGASRKISSSLMGSSTVRVEKSVDLVTWRELGVFESEVVDYAEEGPGETAFYRATSAAWTRPWAPEMRYINQLRAFRSWLVHGTGRYEPGYLKFVIVLAEPDKVYFHADYLHYSFVSEQLPGFEGITQQQFDDAALVREGQRLLLGTVFFPSSAGPRTEYGIQFVGNEPYPAEFVLEYINRVNNRVVSETPLNVLYFPEYEQARAAEESRAYLLAHGIETSSLARWTVGDFTYSEGWAAGRLKYFPANEIDSAYLSGALMESDILMTDFVPADLPRVAGIIALSPSSPGSHVAILARAEMVPFVYLAGDALRELAESLIGKEILFRADEASSFPGLYPGAPGAEFIKLLDVTGQGAMIGDALDRAKPIQPLEYQKKEKSPRFSADTKDLYAADLKYFGGKATHFGLLRRTIHTNSPDARAISFDLWDEFMQQEWVPGQTLRSAIDARLERGIQAQNPAALAEELDGIRTMIKSGDFTESQRSRVTTVLGRFDSSRNIRFRSSSNVEDSATFIAAGLYDSYSGCLDDDLDGDEIGPSLCDHTEEDERGVFRAIKKVFASFYNDGAFMERQRRAVNEHEVGMALLVHHSFPDEIELANGVVLLTYSQDPYRPGERILNWVQTTQKGAVSVANPEGGAVPEILEGGRPGGRVLQWSSLVPSQQAVLHYAEYEMLASLLFKTAGAYAALNPEKAKFVLDYEFKLDPTGIVIKQVREVPIRTNSVAYPICFSEDVQFRTEQSASGDFLAGGMAGPFAAHYAKSAWLIRVGPFEMTPERLAEPFYTNVTVQVHENSRIRTFEGALNSLPGYKHSFSNDVAVDEWSFEPGGPVYEIKTFVGSVNVSGSRQVQTAKDWRLEMKVKYPEEKLCISVAIDDFHLRNTNIVSRTNVFATLLAPVVTTNQNSLPVFRTWKQTNEWELRSDYYWVRRPETAFGGAGYTSPLVDWQGTRVEGFTSAGFSLTGFFSQTYTSKRKNIRESFVFDPWLEAGVPEAILRELEAANIRQIYCSDVIGLIGFDGEVRFKPAWRDGYPGFPTWVD